MIHDTTIVNTGRKDRKTNMEIKKPYSVVHYNKFMKGRPVPQFSLTSEENCEMVKKKKKMVLFFFNFFFFKKFFL